MMIPISACEVEGHEASRVVYPSDVFRMLPFTSSIFVNLINDSEKVSITYFRLCLSSPQPIPDPERGWQFRFVVFFDCAMRNHLDNEGRNQSKLENLRHSNQMV